MTAYLALDVPCPDCLSPTGSRCRRRRDRSSGVLGSELAVSHAARREAARQQNARRARRR